MKSSSFEISDVRATGHNIFHFALVIISFLTFIATIFFNASASITNIILEIFKQATNKVSDKYSTNITPAGWTFSTWGIIYTWQGLWLVYNIVLLFRKNNNGRFYRTPGVLTPAFHLFFIANLCFNTTWLFLWDEEKLAIAWGCLELLTILLYVCIFMSHKNIYDATTFLSRNNRIDLWLMRIFVNNGLSFYATWVTIASSLNLTIAMTYEWNVTKETATLVSLSVLATIIIIYFILDIYVCEKYTRYTWSPYIQMAIAFAGVLSKNWNPQDSTAIFSLALAIVGPGFMFVTKIIVTLYKACKS